MNPLKKWRDELDLSQKDFAEHLSRLRGATVTQAQVSNWERWNYMSRTTLLSLVPVSGGRLSVDSWDRLKREFQRKEAS